ncbi:hypothetical protein ACFX1Q_023159 [Malus domestica]
MDLDLALREDEPAALTETSTTKQKAIEDEPTALIKTSNTEQKAKYEKWHKAGRIALLVMKKAMTENVRGGIPKSEKAKKFFATIGKKFKESEKAKTGNFLTKLTTIRFDGTKSV